MSGYLARGGNGIFHSRGTRSEDEKSSVSVACI